MAEQLGLEGMPQRLYPCTPSRLNTWLECPRRYRMTYLDRPAPPKGPPWAHNSLGLSVHNALASWWRLPLPERTPEAAGTLLLRGWIAAGLDPASVTVVDPRPSDALTPLFEQGVRHSTTAPTEPQDVVVLAVKPQLLDEAAAPLAPALVGGTLLLSVAAGRTVASIEAASAFARVVLPTPLTPTMDMTYGRRVRSDVAGGAVMASISRSRSREEVGVSILVREASMAV